MVMRTAAFQERQQDKRASLLRRAGDVFAEQGYRQCGVETIIARLGVSKGGFYWHFESKEDLYCQVCRIHCEKCRAVFGDLLGGNTIVTRPAILDAACRLLDWFMDNPAEIRLVFDFHRERGSEKVRQYLSEMGADWHRALTGLIERCRHEDAIETPVDSGVLAQTCLVFFYGLLFEFQITQDRDHAMKAWRCFLTNLLGTR